MTDQAQSGTKPDFWHRSSVTLEGMAHGAFVELPAKFAWLVDLATRNVNQLPRAWGGTQFTENPLQYEESVRKGAQKIYDKVNGWTGYKPPELVDDTDVLLYAGGEVGGQLLAPAGMATKGAGLITSAPKLSSAFGAAKWMGMGLLKHFKLPALGFAVDGYANDFGVTNWVVGNGKALAAEPLKEQNDAPGTGGKTYNEVHPLEEESRRGHLDEKGPVPGDSYSSWMDPIEEMSGIDIPDKIEEIISGGLHSIANSSFADWLADGGAGARFSLGLVSMLASNALLDKVIGNSMMSGVLSLGFAGVAAATVPSLVKNFASAGGKAQEETQVKTQETVIRNDNVSSTLSSGTKSLAM